MTLSLSFRVTEGQSWWCHQKAHIWLYQRLIETIIYTVKKPIGFYITEYVYAVNPEDVTDQKDFDIFCNHKEAPDQMYSLAVLYRTNVSFLTNDWGHHTMMLAYQNMTGVPWGNNLINSVIPMDDVVYFIYYDHRLTIATTLFHQTLFEIRIQLEQLNLLIFSLQHYG